MSSRRMGPNIIGYEDLRITGTPYTSQDNALDGKWKENEDGGILGCLHLA